VILDNPSAHKNGRVLRWAGRNKVELCFTPTNASWAHPIEAHFGPLRQFTLANSNHTVQTRELHRYLRWRNENAQHPHVLAAQRRERARVRNEKGIRWGGRPLAAAASTQPREPMRSQHESNGVARQGTRPEVVRRDGSAAVFGQPLRSASDVATRRWSPTSMRRREVRRGDQV